MRKAMVLAIGLGLIVVPVSELMFWPVQAETIAGLVVFYALCALLAALLVERSGARGWVAFVLGGGIFGWLIEGVVVDQTYEAVPLSLAWTPLAWHMALSVMGGVVALGWALRRGLLASVLTCAAIGAVAGLWGAYGWTELAEDVAAPGAGLSFSVQILIASAMIGLGHLVLGHVPAGASRVPDWILWVLSAQAALVWAVVWAVPLFPVSLAVPLLIGISVLALWRSGKGRPEGMGLGGFPGWRVLACGMIAVVAIPVQAAMVQVAWVPELNAFFALPLVLLGTGAWLAALLRGVWPKPSAR
ncbi:hypothetical protein [Gymnodinialimonas ulvae]|uniref:hypothetical protein n=1 Tax=Gymnodinialimonas ulvae TaxID=3126504 RepID=UPI0030A28D02